MAARMRQEIKDQIRYKGKAVCSAIIKEMLAIVQATVKELATTLHKVVDPVLSKIPKEFQGLLDFAGESNAKDTKVEVRMELEGLQTAISQKFS